MSRLRAAATSGVTLASGLSLAVVPAATLSIAGALFDVDDQGVVAVVIMVATFGGQLLVGGVVEARLASISPTRRVVFPRWLGLAGIAAAIAVAAAPPNVVLIAVALPLMLAALEVARAVSISERLDGREWIAAGAVGAGAVIGVVAGLLGSTWALTPLALGVAIATAVRLAPVPYAATSADVRTRSWILADTGVSGIIYPLMNAVVLASLGPAQSVQFTAIATVSGALAIPLNFLRARLLKEHSRLDIVLTSLAVTAAAGVILLADLAGLFGLLFGDAWRGEALIAALAVACLWRAASLATTIPFAALRRSGAVALVTALRAAVSILTLVFAVGGVAVGTVLAVFAALLVAECVSAGVYGLAWRRIDGRARTARELP